MSKKGKPLLTSQKIKRGTSPVAESKISISLQYLSKNKRRNFEFFGKKDFRMKMQALEHFINFIQRLTTKSRLEISSLAKDEDCGFELIPFMQINCNPSNITLSDDTKICIFRFNDNYRVLGFFDYKRPVLNIIGFDFDYSAYEH